MIRILVAEDDSSTRTELVSILISWGYDVVWASDGDKAWKLLQSQPAPQLVILDWMMPELDGIQVCQNIRQSLKPGSTYVILLTVNDQREDIVEGFRAGADDYITKPFKYETLRARLQVGLRIIQYSTGPKGAGTYQSPSNGGAVTGDSGDSLDHGALDFNEVLEYFGGDQGLLEQIAGIFVKSSTQLLYDMRDALRRGDSEALWRSAHSLKGSVRYFSKDAALRLALRLEMIGRSGQLAQAREAYEALEAEMVRLKPSLVAISTGGGSSES